MPRNPPPIEHQFPRHRQDHTKKGPYFGPKLSRFLRKKINYEDPETQKIIKGEAGDAVAWRLILSASQGEGWAVKELLDRLDGKVPQPIVGEKEIANPDEHFKQIADAIKQSDTDSNRLLQR
jgi:hypothetical protein